MTGILAVMAGGSGSVVTDTFNLVTVGTLPATALVGYGDGSAGTSGGAVSTISGQPLTGGSRIVEASYTNVGLNVDRLRLKGFSADPHQAWLIQITINSVTKIGSAATYTWDGVNSCATWQWSPGLWGMLNGNTYNGNTIKHQTP